MNSLLKIKKSKVSGNGIFATSNINKGKTICFFEGEEISIYEMFKRVEDEIEAGSDPLQIADETYLDLDEVSRSFNHSCNPNAFIKGKKELIAIRDIRTDEEIKYDYSTTMNDNEEKLKEDGSVVWTCKCKCGEPNCRKIIDQFRKLPKEIKEFYLKNKIAPDFILKKFNNPQET